MTEKITNASKLRMNDLLACSQPITIKWSVYESYIKRVGLASRRKLRTWVYLRLRLARPCVNLRWLVLTLVEIKFARTSTHVFHLLLANEIQDMSASRVYLWRNLAVRLATQRKSLRKFNLPLFATTCDSVWLYTKVAFPQLVRLSEPSSERFLRFLFSRPLIFHTLGKTAQKDSYKGRQVHYIIITWYRFFCG